MNAPATKIEAATLASAMAAAFGEIEGATKSSPGQVGQQKYKYADLTSVIEAIKPALIKHGLFFTQRPQPSENGVTITTVLHHASGEWLELGSLFVPANKNDAQGFGSALTYARRYALVTAFGVPVEDDDGNAASANRQHSGSGQGQNGGRQVSPDTGPATLKQQLQDSIAETRDLPFPQGPAKNKTELKAMGRSLWREIEGCGDDIEMSCLLGEPTNVELVRQIKDALPSWWDGFEKDGEVHDGLCDVIAKKTKEFTATALDNAR